MFVAGRPINVERNGKLVTLAMGEPCPEAATFAPDVLARCMKVGQILNVERPPPGDEEVTLMAAMQSAQHKARLVADGKVETRKAASTHEVNNGPAKPTPALSAINKAKRKHA